MNKKDKVDLHFSIIEITRKCNLRCEHCLRGDAQNITITKEIIDNFLDNINTIQTLNFSGGEPLLALDEIEYTIDKIIEKKMPIIGLAIITNGTILDKRVADMLNKYDRYLRKNFEYLENERVNVELLISNSEFHDNAPQKAYDFYRPLLDECVSLGFRRDENGVMDGLVNSGRAVNISEEQYRKTDIPTAQHRIFYIQDGTPEDIKRYEEKTGNTILCTSQVFPCIQLCANGNVELSRPCSFIEEDKGENIICNMKTKVSLADAINEWNKTHLLTRREATLLDGFLKENAKKNIDKDDAVKKSAEFLIEARKKAMEMFPYLDFREISMLVFAEWQIELGSSCVFDTENFTMEECKNVVKNMDNLNKERAIENGDISQGLPYMEQMGLSGLLISGLMGLANLLGKKR